MGMNCYECEFGARGFGEFPCNGCLKLTTPPKKGIFFTPKRYTEVNSDTQEPTAQSSYEDLLKKIQQLPHFSSLEIGPYGEAVVYIGSGKDNSYLIQGKTYGELLESMDVVIRDLQGQARRV